ncbi:alpha/beta fold hydrolase [Paraburkholderia agricolaris]|uniref:Alpha/beta fold hydrolase n=1 Tax=Paraburkholderia agricolaris TaxID=2152888 RepID=A0ABW8ZSP1_9BURK
MDHLDLTNDSRTTMNSGVRSVQIHDDERDVIFTCVVQYPTLTDTSSTTIGPYAFDATLNAPIAAGQFPICLVSHGGGGSHLLYRSIGTHLSKNGYIVIALEHFGDNRNDRSLADTDAGAELRPRHAVLTLDTVLGDPFFKSAGDSKQVAVLGHSMGGYTALALIGGQPYSRSARKLAVKADPRFRAAVLLAPATDWYRAPGSLNNVTAPVLVIAGERDSVTRPEDIRETLSPLLENDPSQMIVVPDAGHFSFLAPFPAHMRRNDFPPSSDPEGFNREQFHLILPERILGFLNRTLITR